jgi:hypothetical protein
MHDRTPSWFREAPRSFARRPRPGIPTRTEGFAPWGWVVVLLILAVPIVGLILDATLR